MYSDVFGFEGLVLVMFSNMALRESREVALVRGRIGRMLRGREDKQ